MTELQELTEVPPGAKIVHAPHGFVALEAWVASDLDVVNAARVSFRKRSELADVGVGGDAECPSVAYHDTHRYCPSCDFHLEERLGASDEKVLRFLLNNKHGTPFEHTMFRFHVRAPIFVFREWHRHRIGISINEESARYVELKPDFYVPDLEHCRRQTDKPGRYKFEQMIPDLANDARVSIEDAYNAAYAHYRYLIDSVGLAKEIARCVLPVGIYSQMWWTCNARSLMSFLALRNADTALAEIRDYAAAMEEIFAEKMPVTHSAFVENGRVAP